MTESSFTAAAERRAVTGGRCPCEVRRGDQGDHLVLAVRRGHSSVVEDRSVRAVLRTQLLDHGRVVVDLSQVTVERDSLAELFPSALAEAGGWPLARLVLARADAPTARILQIARVHLTVPVATTLEEARVLLDVRPPQVARDHALPCSSTAPALARSAVASACGDWELDDSTYDSAATAATELVTNAVQHAGTACVLQLTFDRRHLQIAVRDGRPLDEGRPEVAVDRGYGLLVVQGLSRSWGVTPCTGGKTVWVLLDTEHDPLSTIP